MTLGPDFGHGCTEKREREKKKREKENILEILRKRRKKSSRWVWQHRKKMIFLSVLARTSMGVFDHRTCVQEGKSCFVAVPKGICGTRKRT